MGNNSKKSGFVILFATVVSSIIFAIAIFSLDVAYRQIRLAFSAKDSGDAFFGADTLLECALFNDKAGSGSFRESGGSGPVICQGRNIDLSGSYPVWSFALGGLGSAGRSCATVTVDKSDTPVQMTAKGYSQGGESPESCNPPRTALERQLDLSY